MISTCSQQGEVAFDRPRRWNGIGEINPWGSFDCCLARPPTHRPKKAPQAGECSESKEEEQIRGDDGRGAERDQGIGVDVNTEPGMREYDPV